MKPKMPDSPQGATVEKEKSAAGSLIELVMIVAVALGLALLIQAFLVKPFRIPSQSMEPTLDVGQRVLVDRVSFHFRDPHRGDVVVFKPPHGADENRCGVDPPPVEEPCPKPTADRSDTNFIKRIVAVPGDRLSVKSGRVYINGKLRDPYNIRPDAGCGICNLPKSIKIPADHYFMMGDNRGESADSREWGPVPRKWIIGNAFFTYWPPKRIGLL
jgi:signal peptidase I